MRVKSRIYLTLVVNLLFIIMIDLLVMFNRTGAAVANTNKSISLNINDEEKTNFYLDYKTKHFLKMISLKEKMLKQMIRNIAEEMQARGQDKQILDDIGFDPTHAQGDVFWDEYNSEIQTIKEIVFELEKLELVFQRKDDFKLLNEIENVKNELRSALGNYQSETKDLSNQEIAQKFNEYSAETDSVLKIYDFLAKIQKNAFNVGDEKILKYWEQQKTRIINILEEIRIAGTAPDNVVQDYIEEATAIGEILRQIDQLKFFVDDDSNTSLDIKQLQTKIVGGLDERMLKLFGIPQPQDSSKIIIADYYKDWKEKKISAYQLRYTKCRNVINNLITSATVEECNRMFENEISDAFLNYAGAEYELAGMQLKRIYNIYSSFCPNLDNVIFYGSEANYAMLYYDSAAEGFLNILENYPNSMFRDQCYLRLLEISFTFNEHNKFFEFYDKLSEFKNINKEDKNKADYLAANLMAHLRRFDAANGLLKNIDSKSKYFAKAQYLRGLVLANLNEYRGAKKSYKILTDNKKLSRTDINISKIAQESLLKLGYVHFGKGEYEKALSKFTLISQGFSKYNNSFFDQSWESLKQSQYDFGVNLVELQCFNYLMSNYAYEGSVLSAFCKRVQQRSQAALPDLQYVTNSKQITDQAKEYGDERNKISQKLDRLKILEANILERQNNHIYPKIVKLRALIKKASTSFRYRGTISSRVLEKYNNERKLFVKQVEEFNKIIKFADDQINKELLTKAVKQQNRLVDILSKYQLEPPVFYATDFFDNPLATKDGGIIYRQGVVEKLVHELITEKRSVQKDLDIIAALAQIQDNNTKIDVYEDLEILKENFEELNNQLSSFQVWLVTHKSEDIKTQGERRANFSGFSVNDDIISQSSEQNENIIRLSENVSKIVALLKKKKRELEQSIVRFDKKMKKVQKEIEQENVRLEKLEKEKYFQELYFETKTSESEHETLEEKNIFNFQKNDK
jgi:hypothetical protein